MVRRHRSSAVERYMAQTRAAPGAAGAQGATPVYGLHELTALVAAEREDGADVPDLLHARPCARIDGASALRALEFAFAAGDSAGVASSALETAALTPSDWQPESFAAALFIDELIEGVLRFEVEGRPATLASGYLKRLLTQPPADPGHLAVRQAVLRELRGAPAQREALRATYAHIARLLALMDESSTHSRYDMPRWRLDVLTTLRALFDSLHGPFAESTSALKRLDAFARHVRESEGYEALCGLLDFEGEMAQVDLRVRIGADGRPRGLEVLAQRERREARFYRGPLRRWLSRVAGLLRGYRLQDVDLVERWFDRVYGGVVGFLPAVLQLRGDLEFYLAADHFEALARKKGLRVSLPSLTGDRGEPHKRLEGLFNPLLLLHDAPPVPCDLDLDSFRRACILTGPNSGGKTRLLQALALTQLLGQAGFLVPARRALLRPASGMFVSLGDEPAADQREGRLGTELLRIRRLFERATPGYLVLLDELCSGTNPSEGEEIFSLVVELLRELEPEVYITTHFLQFAQRLAESGRRDLCFLQVELDAEHLPTYQFVPGVATTSLAQQTAARLGVSREELLRLIRRHRKGRA